MDQHRIRWNMLRVSTVILGFSTWIFTSFVISTRPEQSAPNTLTSLVRLPASLPTQIELGLVPKIKVADPVRMETLKVPCLESAAAPESFRGVRWVRLMGKICSFQSQATVDVRNATNGYTATVFPTATQQLTTDYIPLVDGENDVVVRVSGQDHHVSIRF